MTKPKEPKVKNYTPVFDIMAEIVGPIAALVFGVVWRHAQMRDGSCFASKRTLAELTGLSLRTINYKMVELIDQDLINDRTPNMRYRPHVYLITERADKLIEKGMQKLQEGMQNLHVGVQNMQEGMQEMHNTYATDAVKDTTTPLINHEDTNEDTTATPPINIDSSKELVHLKESLIYIQRFKSALMDSIFNENRDIEYTDILERAIETHWGDLVYYALDGRKVNAGDFINRDNLLELYYFSGMTGVAGGMAYMDKGFYEERFAGNWEVGLK